MQLKRKMYGWGCLCSLLITCLACTLPYLHLVSVVFGTAIPTSLNIFGKMFLTLGAHAQRGLRYLYSVCVCVCLSHRANLQTGTSRRLTEGTSGLSSTFFTNVKGRFL